MTSTDVAQRAGMAVDETLVAMHVGLLLSQQWCVSRDRQGHGHTIRIALRYIVIRCLASYSVHHGQQRAEFCGSPAHLETSINSGCNHT